MGINFTAMLKKNAILASVVGTASATKFTETSCFHLIYLYFVLKYVVASHVLIVKMAVVVELHFYVQCR